MNTFVSIFVKSGINSPKYIIVPLKGREIAFRNNYKEVVKYNDLAENIRKDAD